ncbi:phosphatidylinositol-specific phospholipase C/glycerophosphodiester phosphodiesterase family protein [Dyadobacter fanqingshengii]|uniref:Altered inheritance of mitochondria protein 6 n=1 Tax=Dyadobacter fanqingshengii TaxID=2906443 RepID=A0A9X1P9R7_9BACT|nr:phosphatidylinositol-specific phospholipase C/glycerophosphodiester phosphodiesterase family protein [Dyadobacter fanqingshengii]MCF0039315.1 phosphatidylinositol-specific phospholipase C/glycerophosphodiester phosphodiesterase family protein [Dyadobacter fanqingshengii]USJ33869.1 phosphatidylinositol-specific phospholipase C/glycerophosphodiester phosphodiesterase family protein [Dyadobacter fanqingshengii]
MKKITTLLVLMLLSARMLDAQDIKAYTTAQAHSHNDYERKGAFQDAYDQQFGSLEADLFLVNDTLFVAHNLKEISSKRTLNSLYIQPILASVEKNGGSIYSQKDVPLQFLIDLKTGAAETLAALVKELEPHKHIFAPAGTIMIVVSGNTPDPTHFEKYPDFIFFDGRPEITYTPDQLKRVGLISQGFGKYSKWNGEGPLPEKEKKTIQKVIKQTHDLGKKMRLWATPDNINSWKIMMSLGVDYLNTDKVKEMGDYLRTAPR